MIDIDVIDGAPGSHYTASLPTIVPALQKYDQLLATAWKLEPCTVHYCKNIKLANKKHWWIVVNLHSDQAGALGYHDVHPNGLPFARVFAADDFQYGVSMSVTIAHEHAEMRVDPDINREWVDGSRAYLVEVGDPVEDDLYGFEIDGVLMSDFVLPAYYSKGTGPYDYKNKLQSGCPTLLSGGYISYIENDIWHQITARYASGLMSYRSQRYGRSARAAARQ